MPIIIDINCLANVFETNSTNHKDFKPVLDWITKGKGKMVFGGSTYLDEFPPKYLTFLNILKKSKKTIEGNLKEIDTKEIDNKKLIGDKDFDDPHIAAIAFVTKCMLICSADKRSFKYLKKRILYDKHFTIPSFYTQLKNKNLLSNKYINDINK